MRHPCRASSFRRPALDCVMHRPTQESNRIELLDVFRGFAILGIFVVNIGAMNSTYFTMDAFARQWTSSLDYWTERFLQLFFYTKFFPIFSLLFGVGIAMQAKKLRDLGEKSSTFFSRRMAVLFLFGCMHITFLWSGDVLHIYAILGLLSVWMISRSDSFLLTGIFFFLLFPFYDQVLGFVLRVLSIDSYGFLASYSVESIRDLMRQGSYGDMILFRWREYVSNIPLLVGYLMPLAFAMFLLGIYLGRKEVYASMDKWVLRIRKPMIWVLMVSNTYRLLFLFQLPETELYRTEWGRVVFVKLMVISDVAFGLFYLWFIAWLWYFSSLQKTISPLRYVGRMALTNYLLQSLIGMLVFTSVGLGMFETLSPFQMTLLAFVVFGGQVIFSRLWLSYFRFGPLEWLWRKLTYSKRLVWKKNK